MIMINYLSLIKALVANDHGKIILSVDTALIIALSVLTVFICKKKIVLNVLSRLKRKFFSRKNNSAEKRYLSGKIVLFIIWGGLILLCFSFSSSVAFVLIVLGLLLALGGFFKD